MSGRCCKSGCRLRACLALVVLALVGGLGAAAPAQASEWGRDPVYVFWPRGDCQGDRIELQVWDREDERWRRHPVHRRVPVDTCQLEDAGVLLHEIRWRCVEPEPPAWAVGIDVFDPARMERCSVDDRVERDAAVELRVTKPAEGERVAPSAMEVAVEGSVWLRGVEGDAYDVLVGIDRSAHPRTQRDLLRAQLEAARSLLERLAPRLGPVRVEVFSYPLANAGGTHRELAFSTDASALAAAFDRLETRGASGRGSFREALRYGVNRLASSQARPGARRVLLLGANAATGRPFGVEATGDARLRDALARHLMEARRENVAVHLFAVGGLADALDPDVRQLLERGSAAFARVVGPELETPFFRGISFPVVTHVVLANRTAGGRARAARTEDSGRFQGTLAAIPGTNRLWARATLSDGAFVEREWEFEFDDRQVRELWLSQERARMERVRREKRLEIRPAWDEVERGMPPEVRPAPAPQAPPE